MAGLQRVAIGAVVVVVVVVIVIVITGRTAGSGVVSPCGRQKHSTSGEDGQKASMLEKTQLHGA